MKRLTSLVCSLIIGAFMCTGASAHNPKPQQNDLVVLGVGEHLRIVGWANCNVPQDEEDASVVPLEERSISFDLVIEGQTVGGNINEYVETITLLSGGTFDINVPASIGNILHRRADLLTGRGVCNVSFGESIVGASGETRARSFGPYYYRPYFYRGD